MKGKGGGGGQGARNGSGTRERTRRALYPQSGRLGAEATPHCTAHRRPIQRAQRGAQRTHGRAHSTHIEPTQPPVMAVHTTRAHPALELSVHGHRLLGELVLVSVSPAAPPVCSQAPSAAVNGGWSTGPHSRRPGGSTSSMQRIQSTSTFSTSSLRTVRAISSSFLRLWH